MFCLVPQDRGDGREAAGRRSGVVSSHQTMSLLSDSVSEEERSLFQPFTRESLHAIQLRIAEEDAKQKELEKKRAEGEVIFSLGFILASFFFFNVNVRL